MHAMNVRKDNSTREFTFSSQKQSLTSFWLENMWTWGWNCPEGLSQPSFVKFDPVVSVEKIIIWQANDDHRQTDDGCETYAKWYKSSHGFCWRKFIKRWWWVFNSTFNNILVIMWQSMLLVEETGVSSESNIHAVSYKMNENGGNDLKNVFIFVNDSPLRRGIQPNII